MEEKVRDVHFIPYDFTGQVKILMGQDTSKAEMVENRRAFWIEKDGKVSSGFPGLSRGLMKSDIKFYLVESNQTILKEVPWISSHATHHGIYDETIFNKDSLVVFNYGPCQCKLSTYCRSCKCNCYYVDTIKRILNTRKRTRQN